MTTFKQYLTELMVDIDPTTPQNDLVTNIRKQQMLSQRSPTTVAKQQADAASAQRKAVDADTTSPPDVKALMTQISRVKEQLMRLQQQLARRQQSMNAKQPNQPTAPTV